MKTRNIKPKCSRSPKKRGGGGGETRKTMGKTLEKTQENRNFLTTKKQY
jgi:hypothetical protein